MALQFNNWAKEKGILTNLRIYSVAGTSLRIYPASVPFPTVPPVYNAVPAGFLIDFTVFTTKAVGNQFKLTIAPLPTAAVATGDASWFFYRSGTGSANGVIVSDSIGLIGSGSLAIVDSVSMTSGTLYNLLDLTLTLT